MGLRERVAALEEVVEQGLERLNLCGHVEQIGGPAYHDPRYRDMRERWDTYVEKHLDGVCSIACLIQDLRDAVASGENATLGCYLVFDGVRPGWEGFLGNASTLHHALKMCGENAVQAQIVDLERKRVWKPAEVRAMG